jgi:hypothetical protein
MPFTVRYVFSFEDYKTLCAVIRPRSRFGAWPLRLATIAVLFAGWPLLWFAARGSPITPYISICVGAAVLLRYALDGRIQYKRCHMAGQTLTCELGEKSIAWTRDNMRGEFDWASIRAVIVRPAAIVFLTGKLVGFVLPARAFDARQEFEAAADFALAHAPVSQTAPSA